MKHPDSQRIVFRLVEIIDHRLQHDKNSDYTNEHVLENSDRQKTHFVFKVFFFFKWSSL